MILRKADTDKSHRCPNCWAVLNWKSADSDERRESTGPWKFIQCYRCGIVRLPYPLTYIRQRIWRWNFQRSMRKLNRD